MSTEKYRKIAADLEALLSRNNGPKRLPAQRQVMAEYQVSSRTVHKAFQLLKQRKVISTSPRGSVASSQQGAVHRCFIFTNSEPFADDALLQRLRQLAEKEKYEYVPVILNKDRTISFQELGCSRYDVGVFAYSSFRTVFLPELQKCQMPVVTANRLPPDIPVNWVDWNHLEIFDNIIGELLIRGARKIGFFSSANSDRADNTSMIAEDFIRAKRSYSLYNRQLDAFPVEKYGDVKAYVEFLQQLKQQPDAVVVFGTDQYRLLTEELQLHGMEKLARRLFFWGTQQTVQPASACNAGFYSDSCYRQLAEKLWKLLKYSASHPDAPPCGLKQHCVVKYRIQFRKTRKLL